ncbi:hypothetical protein ACFWC2_14330 [Streptomyces diastaticus]|uniref:hypothetical protein n=1 Tax=Streptomyces diastaticus TaxID=1956 RepID=UPI0033CB060D
MSARITLHCETAWRYGSCPAQVMTNAPSVSEAREAADRIGWRFSASRDYCPPCSGTGPAVPVIHLPPNHKGRHQ